MKINISHCTRENDIPFITNVIHIILYISVSHAITQSLYRRYISRVRYRWCYYYFLNSNHTSVDERKKCKNNKNRTHSTIYITLYIVCVLWKVYIVGAISGADWRAPPRETCWGWWLPPNVMSHRSGQPDRLLGVYSTPSVTMAAVAECTTIIT